MKKIAVVALDPLAGASYTKEVRDLFGEYAEVVGYSVRDGSAAGVLPRADLFAISTDAYGSAEEEARHVPIDSQIMSIEVTFYWETLKKLFEIPQGTKVLFVNVTSNMAREAITQLSSLGVNHLQFIPYYPGAVLEEPVDIAVTPGESRFVPPSVKTVIDCDHRPCSYGMMVEIALRLGLEYLPETESFMNYAKVVASNHYSFDLMDVAMSISSAMKEIYDQNHDISRMQLIRAGMRVGRDMMGTDSNTLILAFAGSSVSMLIMDYAYHLPYFQIINSNNIGIALMQGLSGSFGIVLSVPATVAFAAWIYAGTNKIHISF